MTNSTETKTTKRAARKPRETKTGLQIMAHINSLKDEVNVLETEIANFDQASPLYPTVSEVVAAKRAELDKELETVYTI